jgi:hypothetical protein
MANTKRRLDEAQKLLTKGLITEDEYEQRRQAILADTSAEKGSVAGGILKWGGIGCLSIIGGFVLLVVLIVVIIAVAAGGGGNGIGGDDVRASFAEGSSGEVSTAGGVKNKVTITKITDPATSNNQFEQPQPGYHYTTVAVTIENTGERETTGVDVILRATDGTEYNNTFLSGVGATDLNQWQSLTSGGRTDAVLAFEVKDGTEVEWLKFDPNTFAKGDLYFDK